MVKPVLSMAPPTNDVRQRSIESKPRIPLLKARQYRKPIDPSNRSVSFPTAEFHANRDGFVEESLVKAKGFIIEGRDASTNDRD